MSENHRTLRFMLAVGAGSFGGAWFAHAYHSAWWAIAIGMLIGGILAGGIFVYRDVITMAPIAWRRAKGWRPDWGYLKDVLDEIGKAWIYGFAIGMLTFGVGMTLFLGFFFILLLNVPGPPVPVSRALIAFALAPAFVAFLVSVFCFFGLVSLLYKKTEELRSNVVEVQKKFIRSILEWYARLPKRCLGVLCDTAWSGLIGLKGVLYTIGRFLKHLGVLVYSDELLLCVLCGAFGAGVGGFQFSTPLYGALAGISAGILQYEILSKRVLHLIPMRQNS